ncbi:MAG: hypothetical protein MUP81_06020 [Dehalococcoidia bacterium]|nr:hypothetical protein [Dehalococcoidia bacterium]
MYKTKGFIIGASLLALVLIAGNIGLACGAKPAQEPTSPPPVTEPAPVPSTPPLLPEEILLSPAPVSTKPEIPADFTTYTDETNVFNVSYPSDWELALSSIAGADEYTKEVIRQLNAGIPVDKTSTLFIAGLRTATGGHDPTVMIIVEPVPEEIPTHIEMVEAEIRGAKKIIPDYKQISRLKITIDGREATILEWEGTAPGQTKAHFLQMLTIARETTWLVSCATSVSDFSKWQNDFNAIVRSLRISR